MRCTLITFFFLSLLLACSKKKEEETPFEPRQAFGAVDKKLREAFIYLTADREREVLQIISEVFIGSVKTKLESYVPATRNPGSSVARNAGKVKLVF